MDNIKYRWKEFLICGSIVMSLWCKAAFRKFLPFGVRLRTQKFRREAFLSEMYERFPSAQVGMYDMLSVGQT